MRYVLFYLYLQMRKLRHKEIEQFAQATQLVSSGTNIQTQIFWLWRSSEIAATMLLNYDPSKFWVVEGCRIPCTLRLRAQSLLHHSLCLDLEAQFWSWALDWLLHPHTCDVPQFFWLDPWFVSCIPNTKAELFKRKIRDYGVRPAYVWFLTLPHTCLRHTTWWFQTLVSTPIKWKGGLLKE